MFKFGDEVVVIPGDETWFEHICDISLMPKKPMRELMDNRAVMTVIGHGTSRSTGRIEVRTRVGEHVRGVRSVWMIHPSCLKLARGCVFDVQKR